MESIELEYQKHTFLAELGIEKENQGCYYNGKWTANGEWYHSNNPSSGKAKIK